MKISKKAFAMALPAMLAAVLCIGAIMAYFADADEKQNPFSIGYNTITPNEEFETPIPGQKTVKSPKAANTGPADCYVRAKVLLSDSRAESYITYYNGPSTGMNTRDWVQAADGWLYYGEPIQPGKETAAIFTHIMLGRQIPDGIRDVSIDVIFESVQSDGFDGAQAAFQAVEGNR